MADDRVSHADASFVDFLRRRITVSVATRDAAMVPSVTRAIGYHYAPARARLSIYLPAAHAGPMVDNIGDNGWVAVALAEPSTHVSMQVKGSDARVEPAGPADRMHLAAYEAEIVAEIVGLNYPEPAVRAMFNPDAGALLAVRFTPTQFFAQTPGPGAGRRFVEATRA